MNCFHENYNFAEGIKEGIYNLRNDLNIKFDIRSISSTLRKKDPLIFLS